MRALHNMLAASRLKSTVAPTSNREATSIPSVAARSGRAPQAKRALGDRALVALLLRCLPAVPGKGRFRLVPWHVTRPSNVPAALRHARRFGID